MKITPFYISIKAISILRLRFYGRTIGGTMAYCFRPKENISIGGTMDYCFKPKENISIMRLKPIYAYKKMCI